MKTGKPTAMMPRYAPKNGYLNAVVEGPSVGRKGTHMVKNTTMQAMMVNLWCARGKRAEGVICLSC